MKNISKYIIVILVSTLTLIAFFVFVKKEEQSTVYHDKAFSQKLDELLSDVSKQIQFGKTINVAIEKPCEADHCITLCSYFNLGITIDESYRDSTIEYLISRQVPAKLAKKISGWGGAKGSVLYLLEIMNLYVLQE